MKVKLFIAAWITLLVVNSYAQQEVMPGRILFCIKPEAVEVFRSAFYGPEIHAAKFDPQIFTLSGGKAIASLLGLPAILHASSLKPFIPQHNVVLEDLRERTNPILFTKSNQNSIAIKETDEIARLRSSEEHISRWFELGYNGNLRFEEVIAFLKKSGLVETAEPRYKYTLCYTPNDSYAAQQYSLAMMHLPEAWDIVRCDSTMLVADDDIGADWTHPDLANAIAINSGETSLDSEGFDKRSNGIDDDGDGFVDDWHGWDFAGEKGDSPDNDPNTPAKHGTHTSGIMAASGNNNMGICGVAFGAKVLVLKCGDNTGSSVAYGYEGIVYAADHGAKVVNNSWGGTNRSQVGQDIVDYAVAKNCVVVAASGNSYAFQDLYPASYDHVLSVAAVDESDNITSFSNYNPHVDVSAPGNNVLSTVPNNGYEIESGTSMASPNASGAVALVMQKFPNLSPDQVIERMRATADVLTPAEDLHPGYTGKGRINAKRAVSEDPVYSARLENVEIFDQNNNGSLESGESADIVLHVRNYLAPLTNLQATIEYLNDDANAISANTQSVQFGKANTLSLVQNFQGSFHITIAPGAPNNYRVLVKLNFNSAAEGYGPDVDYFTLVINKGYLDLNGNNMTVTFDSKGGIGYNDAPSNTQGSGFVWNLAPLSVAIEGRDVLSEGGLMVGIPDSIRIASAAPGEYNDSYVMQDFAATLPINYVTPPDHVNAAQELHTIFNDSNTDPSVQPGVTVDQKNYAFTTGLAANAVVADYVIRKRIVDSVYYLSDSSAASLFMDWDIGASGSNNQAYISGYDSAVSVARRVENAYPYVGMKIISELPAGAQLNIYELNNDGSDGSASTYDGFDRVEKWQTMTTPRAFAGTDDVSMIYGLKNLPLRSQDSVRLTFVIAMAENEQILKQTIDQTEAQWFSTSAVRNNVRTDNQLTVSPNPFGSHIHISWNVERSETPASVTITDAIGRTVFSEQVNGKDIVLNRTTFPAGAYTVTVQSGNTLLRKKMISLP